ncbi:MAG: tetratricopeptide repeat protein [Acidobacteria bacterium]|nr:tetratricopeptide repeat protein [Acidobacteriota bacterium]
MIEPERNIERAAHLLRAAYEKQMGGDFQGAIQLYKDSIAEHPTAEAHTFLGWTYSFLGRYDDAIQECESAIKLDPDFGNPYNDIGSYLVHLGKIEEAIPWLEKAKGAPRYEPRHFPYINLGRIYMKMGKIEQASREFEQASFIQKSLERMDSPEEDAETIH